MTATVSEQIIEAIKHVTYNKPVKIPCPTGYVNPAISQGSVPKAAITISVEQGETVFRFDCSQLHLDTIYDPRITPFGPLLKTAVCGSQNLPLPGATAENLAAEPNGMDGTTLEPHITGVSGEIRAVCPLLMLLAKQGLIRNQHNPGGKILPPIWPLNQIDPVKAELAANAGTASAAK